MRINPPGDAGDSGGLGPSLEGESALPGIDDHRIAWTEAACQDLLGQRVLQLVLDGPLEGPRPVNGIEACLADAVEARICSLFSGWKTTTSSTRLMNSGLKCWLTTSITDAFICS